MANESNKKTKISGLLQYLFSFLKTGTNYTEIPFTKDFLDACGCPYLLDVSDDVTKKLYYGSREMNKNIKDSFADGKVDFNKCTKFLASLIDTQRINELFDAFQVSKDLEKDINIFYVAVATQMDNFRKYKEGAVSDTIRNIYRRLLIEKFQSTDYNKMEEIFSSLPPTEQNLLNEYIKKIKEIHKRVISIVNPTKTYKFYEIYVFNNIQYEDEDDEGNDIIKTIESVDTTTLFNLCPNNLLIEAKGGIGKTMLMKHLLLDSVNNFKKTHILPLLLNVHDYTQGLDFFKFLINSIDRLLEYSLDENTLLVLLNNGMLTILLDGLDELDASLAVEFYKNLEEFARKYSKNRFVLTSRPPSSPNPIIDFKLLNLMPLTKFQSNQLIQKLDYDPDIKEAFLSMMNTKLVKTHKLFCENPLLLTIMLMTFDKSGIPESKYMFYKKAYYTMAEKYDPTRGKYIRSLATKLTPDRMYDYIMEFAFRTYYDGAVIFSESDIDYYFNDLKESKRYENEQCSSNDFITDLEKHLCLLHKDGNRYRFIHRSFQEFFCAAYFNKQKDSSLSAIGNYLDRKQRINDTVIYFESYLSDFLFDMSPNRFEEFIFLPYLEKFSKNGVTDEGFIAFLTNVYSGQIDYQDGDASDFGVNFPQSQLFILLAEKYNFTQWEVLRLTPREPFWAISYCKLYNFQGEPCIYDVTTKEEREQCRDDETLCGDGYKIYTSLLEKNMDKYKDIVEELKSTYLYIHYASLVGIYNSLKKKYKKRANSDLVSLLE